MKQTSNTIKAAKIGAYAILAAAIISGLFLLIEKKPENGKSNCTTITSNDSSKVLVTNNQNDIKGDYINGDKIVVNKNVSKEKEIPEIDAPKALIVTQNQTGDNTLNITQISDSYATSNDGSYIKEISYPSSGEFGINILDSNNIKFSVGTYSMNALIPKNQNLIVEISAVKGKCAFPAFQSIPGWRWFDFKENRDTVSRKFKTVKFGIVDLEFYLQEAGEINISVHENESKTVTWRKTLKVEN